MTTESKALETITVSTFTNGILDPGQPMLGPVMDGAVIKASRAPGCWGPMINPRLRGGHGGDSAGFWWRTRSRGCSSHSDSECGCRLSRNRIGA